MPGYISPALKAQIERNPEQDVNLFVRGDADCIAQEVEGLGGLVKMRMNGLVSVRLNAAEIPWLESAPCVKGFEFDINPPHQLNDSSRVKSRVQWVNDGVAPLQQGYDGTGVIMGIIDTGLDMDHPDFQNADGSTRVLKFWDQTEPVDSSTPAQYGYGQICDSAAINAGTCTFGEQLGSFGHGTTIASAACGTGNANGMHRGGAPGADLLIVSSEFDDPNWTSTVADAVDWIFAEAEAMGMPAVVNASLGSYLGSHDGKDAAALFIDSLLMAKEGRVMVCAAGNSYSWPLYHMETQVTADTSFTWFDYNSSSALGHGAVYFEVWADTADFNNVQYAIGADQINPNYAFRGNTAFRNIQANVGGTITDSLYSSSGNLLGVVEYFAQLRGGQYHLTVHMNEPDSNAYHFRFMTTGSGSFDVWTADFFGFSSIVDNIPTVAQYPSIADYVSPDNNKTMVSSWACSDQVITTANYYNETSYIDVNGNPQSVTGTEDDISANSSAGPTRDGRIKPDLAAPGDITIVAAPFQQLTVLTQNEPFKVAQGGMHIRQGGTSIASPVVAAAAALYLQQCHKATHTEVINAFESTAFGDAFATGLPNARWGNGKINAFDAITPTVYTPSISVFGDSSLCPGDSMLVSGPMQDGFLWSTGDTSKVFWVDTATTLSLITTDNSGCLGFSDTIQIIQYPAPTTPTIVQSGNLLTSSNASGYQWLFEGGPIGGETNQTLVVNVTGNYQVQITDANGCTALSDTLFYLNVGVNELQDNAMRVWPSPSEGPINVGFNKAFTGAVTIVDQSGRVLFTRDLQSANSLRVDIGLGSGSYFLIAKNEAGNRQLRRFKILE